VLYAFQVDLRPTIYGLAELDPEHFQAPSLESPEGKLRRAEEHLQDLRDEIAPLESPDAHAFVIRHDADARQYIFEVSGVAEAKPEWGYIVGDCIHNLRSSLDHLILQLAILGQGGRHLTDREIRSCEFPIYSDPDEFKKRGEGRVRLLRPGERARIAELQPFHASDISIWGPEPGIAVPTRAFPAFIPTLLRSINDLDIADKHRRVNATWRSANWYAHPEPPEPFRESSIYAGVLKDNAEVGRWGYEGAKPELPPDMDVQSYFPISVAIGEAATHHGYGALDFLGWSVEAVQGVIDLFRPCFETTGPAKPVRDLTGIGLWTWLDFGSID